MKMYKNLIDSKPWKFSVVILIGLCALFLGLERSSNSLMSKQTIMILDYIFTLLFTAEIIIRILAANNLKSFFKVRDKEQNTNYFDADGLWNIFDLSLVEASIVSFIIQYFMNQSSHVEIFFVARLLRVSRVLRLFEVHEEIKRIERKILSVLPTIGSFLVLLSAIVFTYAIIGSHLFGECISCGKNIAGSFEDIGSSLQTVVLLLTMDGWGEIMTEVQLHSPILGTMYFVSFIFLIGVVFLNIFIAVLVSNIEDSMEVKWKKKKRLNRILSFENKIDSLENEVKTMKDDLQQQNQEIIRLLNNQKTH